MKTTKLNSLTSLINKAFNNEAIDANTAIEKLDNFRDLLSDFARDSEEIATIRKTLNLDTVDLQCEFETKVELLESEIAQQLAYRIIEQNTFEQCLDLFRNSVEIDVTEYFTVDELTEIFFKEQQNEVYDLETEKQLDCVIEFATKESYKYQAIVERTVDKLCRELDYAVQVLDEVIYALKSLKLDNIRYIYDTVYNYVKDYNNKETIDKLTQIMQELIDVEVSEFSEQVIEAYETLDKEAFRRLSNEAYSDENSASSKKQMIIENAWESNRDYAFECLEALEAMTDDELKEQNREIKYLHELDQLVFDSSNYEFGKRFSAILARFDNYLNKRLEVEAMIQERLEKYVEKVMTYGYYEVDYVKLTKELEKLAKTWNLENSLEFIQDSIFEKAKGDIYLALKVINEREKLDKYDISDYVLENYKELYNLFNFVYNDSENLSTIYTWAIR